MGLPLPDMEVDAVECLGAIHFHVQITDIQHTALRSMYLSGETLTLANGTVAVSSGWGSFSGVSGIAPPGPELAATSRRFTFTPHAAYG